MKRKTWAAIVCLSAGMSATSVGQTVSTRVTSSGITDALVVDSQGNLFGCDFEGTTVFRVTPENVVTSFATGFDHPNGMTIGVNDTIYLASTRDNAVYSIAPDGEIAQYGPTIQNPNGVYFQPDSDTLIVASFDRNSIIKLAPDGVVVPWMADGELNGPLGLTSDELGRLYVANFTDGKVFRVNADTLQYLASVPQGPLWGTNYACGFLTYTGGYLYATGIAVNRIYRISMEGDLELFAGTGAMGTRDGDAAIATFWQPNGIIPSGDGETLFISDFTTQAVRSISNFTSLEWTPVSLPDQAILHPNYPNPFNPNTEIRFVLKQAGQVELEVVDLLGRSVGVLLNGEQNAGEHCVNFNADGLASGVYFTRLTVGEMTLTRRMVLCR